MNHEHEDWQIEDGYCKACGNSVPEQDDREALADLASRAIADAWTDEGENAAAPYAVADAIIAAGFRRHPEPVKPSREDVRDAIAGHPIGGGYYGTTVGIDEAGEIADAVLALFESGENRG